MNQRFEPSFESLRTYEVPEWFRDAKFGIWSHWGPQSVPMFGDWYARNMYIQGTPQYEYHLRHYGHPSKFGYKDLCELWKAEAFDPEALMDRYYQAGARYFMSQGTHHDHFFNYNSKVNRMNSVNVGPHKDILALWKAAADRHHMPFGMSTRAVTKRARTPACRTTAAILPGGISTMTIRNTGRKTPGWLRRGIRETPHSANTG